MPAALFASNIRQNCSLAQTLDVCGTDFRFRRRADLKRVMDALRLPEVCGPFDNGRTLPREACFLYTIRRTAIVGRTRELRLYFGGEKTMWSRAYRSLIFVCNFMPFLTASFLGGRSAGLPRPGVENSTTIWPTGPSAFLTTRRPSELSRTGTSKRQVGAQLTLPLTPLPFRLSSTATSPRQLGRGRVQRPQDLALRVVIQEATFRRRSTPAGSICTVSSTSASWVPTV